MPTENIVYVCFILIVLFLVEDCYLKLHLYKLAIDFDKLVRKYNFPQKIVCHNLVVID